MLRTSWIFLLGLTLVRAQNGTGPTQSYCDLGYNQCNAFCAQGANQTYRPNTSSRFPDTSVSISQDDLQQFQSLQQEYLIAFANQTMYGEPISSYPGCGTNGTAMTNLAGDGPSKRSVSWSEEITAQQGSQSASKPHCIPETLSTRINFNIITTNASADAVVELDMIANQYEMLTTAFQPLGVSFTKGTINRYSGEGWAPVAQELDPAHLNAVENQIAGLKVGGTDEINVYIVERIGDVTCNGTDMTRVEAFCTLPNQRNNSYDGCYMDIDSLPGSAWRGSVQGDGKALVHELGHWYGLQDIHVSTSDKCENPEATYVNTPVYMGTDLYNSQQQTCCADANGNFHTCSNNTRGHVTNWMSYSDDRGQVNQGSPTYPWTLGQRAALFANYYYFRVGSGQVKCSDGSSMFDQSAANNTATSLRKRGSPNLSGDPSSLFSQPIFIMDTLKEVCAAPASSKEVLINPVTGHIAGPASLWDRLGQWKWVLITAIILTAIIVPMWAAMCLIRFRHKKAGAYAKIGEPANTATKRFSFDSVLALQTRSVESDKVLEAYRGNGPVRYA